MPVSVNFDNDDHSVVRYVFESRWTWDEFDPCWAWLKDVLDASDRPVAVIMDMSASRHIPLDALTHLKPFVKQVHPNFAGAMAVVGMMATGQAYHELLRRFAPEIAARYQFFFVPTLAEARLVLDDWLNTR